MNVYKIMFFILGTILMCIAITGVFAQASILFGLFAVAAYGFAFTKRKYNDL